MSSHTPTYTFYLCVLNQIFKIFKQDTGIETSDSCKLKRQRMWVCLSSEADQAIISKKKVAFQGLRTLRLTPYPSIF